MKFGQNASQVDVNVAKRASLFRTVRERLEAREGFALATLNLDHLTKLPVDPTFTAAYHGHDLVVADGRPVVWLSRLARQPLELMPGSDMIMPLCEICTDLSVPIALVGSSDDSLAGSAAALQKALPDLRVAYMKSPAYGFDPEGPEADTIIADLKNSKAGLCFVALGAPKQEVFAARAHKALPQISFASIGAGLDFLSGHQVRAPLIMRMLALEWLWRLLQDPRNMVPRYAKCFSILPRLVVDAWRQRQGLSSNS